MKTTTSKTVRMTNGSDWVTFETVAGRGVVMVSSLGAGHGKDMDAAERDYRMGLLRTIGWR